jgi:mandelate racemase
VLKEPFPVKNSRVEIPNRPGAGIEWDDNAVRKYRYDA